MASSMLNTKVELTSDEVGTLMFVLENRINDLRTSIINPIYAEDLKQSMKKSLEYTISTYLKVTEQTELDF